MDTTDFVAGVNRLQPLFNVEKCGKMRPRQILDILQRNTGFLTSLNKLARYTANAEITPFMLDMLHTCGLIMELLPTSMQLNKFHPWELQLGDYLGPLPYFDSRCYAGHGRKRKAPDDNDEEDEEDEEDDGGEDNENEEDEDYQETKLSSPKKAKIHKTASCPKVETSSGKAVKQTARSSMTSAPKAPAKLPRATITSIGKNPVKPSKAPAATHSKAPAWRTAQNSQGKFSSAAPLVEATTEVLVPQGPIRKATKTQASSVKDEPVPVANSSKARDIQVAKAGPKPETTSFTSINNPKGLHAPYQLMVRQKTHTAVNTYHYDTKVPEPIKTEEVTTLAQVITKPRYGCCQCSMSVQHQDCVFLGWGHWCNNCEAAGKSLCSFRAEPTQRYNAHHELAKFVEATSEHKSCLNLWVSLQHAAAAQQVFEQSANATALAAHRSGSPLRNPLGFGRMLLLSKTLASLLNCSWHWTTWQPTLEFRWPSILPWPTFVCHPFLVRSFLLLFFCILIFFFLKAQPVAGAGQVILDAVVVEATAPSTGAVSSLAAANTLDQAASSIAQPLLSDHKNHLLFPTITSGTRIIDEMVSGMSSSSKSSGTDSHQDFIVPETPGAISDEDQPLQSPNMGEDSEQVDQLAESLQKAASGSLYHGPKKVSKRDHRGSLNASTISFKKTLSKDDIV
ncbi:hypothetical protein F5146DRAFT_1138321 [Armillaria mellea]|nr:hypothetical protein F5146DRAFT_1138321 [Armillaria mellea]